MAGSQRYQGQAGYVLHGYRYQETSLIIEMFTREFGRVGSMSKLEGWAQELLTKSGRPPQ